MGTANLWTTNWQWTGSNVLTPQATVDVRLEWEDDTGPHEWSGTLTFPNDLQVVPVAWLKEELEDLIIKAARIQLGIDEVVT